MWFLKNDRNLSELADWSPITLPSVDYEILGKSIAKLIEPFSPNLIHSDQMGIVNDRCIGQNIRLLNDLMECTNAKKLFWNLPIYWFLKSIRFCIVEH